MSRVTLRSAVTFDERAKQRRGFTKTRDARSAGLTSPANIPERVTPTEGILYSVAYKIGGG